MKIRDPQKIIRQQRNPGNEDTLSGSQQTLPRSYSQQSSHLLACLVLYNCALLGSRDVVVLLLLFSPVLPLKTDYMTGTTEGLPMDVAEDSRWQQEQQQQEQQEQQEQQQEGEDHKKELDRNELVRARLITLSQVKPEGEVVPLDTLTDIGEGNSPPPPSPSPPSEREDEFRRKLMSISYVDVPMSAQ